MLLHIHQRLTEIFVTTGGVPFAGISIIAFGDLYQLPPINQRPTYAEYKDALLNVSPLWRTFRMAELTEVMRQKDDSVFIDLLNKVRVADVDNTAETILKSKFVSQSDPNYPYDVIHIWAENGPVSLHNNLMLNKIDEKLYQITATDIFPKNVNLGLIEKALSHGQMQTGGLEKVFSVKIGARVMITSNIDVNDKLSNGQIGTVVFLEIKNSEVYNVKLDDKTSGLKLINSTSLARRLKAVPICKIETKIKIHQNKSNSPIIRRTQFPLMLAWTCTVHKVQGKQFEKAVISFDLLKQRRFNFGQIYVALSRVTSLNGLFLIGSYNGKAIQSDPRAKCEYQLLRDKYAMQSVKNCSTNSLSFTASLLNTRSLRKHASDIIADTIITDCDILFLTETQVETQEL